MKKIYFLASLLIGSLSFGQAADGFSYSGSLDSNGWTSHSGVIPAQLATLTGSLSYAGLTSVGNKTSLVSGNTQDANKASAAALTGTSYFSGVINVVNTTGLGANTTTGDYFLHSAATAGGTVTAFFARTYVRAGVVLNTFNLGILNASGGTAAPSFSTTDYPVGTPVFIVVKYDIATNTASLFVNPVIGGTEGTATVTNVTGTTGAPTSIASLCIRQGGTTGNIELDELRIGGAYAYVTAAVLGINQNAIAGLNIYPNPVSGSILNIETAANGSKAVAIFDVLGKQVVNVTTANTTINVANLNAGIYIVKITEEGKTATRKLVIK